MNKTKLVATISPKSKDLIAKLIKNGVNVIRLNMSYSSYDFCNEVIDLLKKVDQELGTNTSIMIDLQGPCIRVNTFQSGYTDFVKGSRIRLLTHNEIGNEYQFSVNYPNIVNDLKYKNRLLLSDGKVILEVAEIGLDYLVLEVKQGGRVYNYSKIFLPGIDLNRKFLTPKDKNDIKYAISVKADYIAVSNITKFEDVLEVNDMLIELGDDSTSIISKFQNKLSLEDMNKVIDVSDGVIVARKDLAVETGLEEVPSVTNEIIKQSQRKGKVSIVTTEMDSFLFDSALTSRSEVSDLSSLVTEGIDSLLLTFETTIGKDPVGSVKEASKVLKTTEDKIDYDAFLNDTYKFKKNDIASTIVSSVSMGSRDVECKAIIVSSLTGYTAKEMSKLRPSCPIIAVTPNERVLKSLNIYFDVTAIMTDNFTFENISNVGINKAKELFNLDEGDKVIITGRFASSKETNFMLISEV